MELLLALGVAGSLELTLFLGHSKPQTIANFFSVVYLGQRSRIRALIDAALQKCVVVHDRLQKALKKAEAISPVI